MRKTICKILCALAFLPCIGGFGVCASDAIVTDIVSDPSIISDPAIVSNPEAASDPAIVSDPEAASNPAIVSDPEAASDPAIVSDPEAASNSSSVSNPSSISKKDIVETEVDQESGIESEDLALTGADLSFEIPLGISDGLQKDTPAGDTAKMSMAECEEFIQNMYDANAAGKFFEKHENVLISFSLPDEETGSWKNYCCAYADHDMYYSDDRTPGLELLRSLIYGKDDSVSYYNRSMGYVRFLNASGTPYRDPGTTPFILSNSTLNETLLAIHQTPDALYVITQMAEDGILKMDLPPVKENVEESENAEEAEAPLFYSCLYVLDPDTLEVQVIRIAAHQEDGSAEDVRNITYSYDHGMSKAVRVGYIELIRHMVPTLAWGEEYTRTVTVTLDPGTDSERTYLTQVLKGDALSITLPEGYVLFSDEGLTQRWIDNGDYMTDLTLWAAEG